MLNTQMRLLQAAQTQQVPHRAPVPQWNNGNGEQGSARQGEVLEPATNSSAHSSALLGNIRPEVAFFISKQKTKA